MPVDSQKARELFLHAVGTLPHEQWEEYVELGCSGDAELKRQVSHLLRSSPGSRQFPGNSGGGSRRRQ